MKASDIFLSILFNLLLTVLLCFFFLFIAFNIFFTSPIHNENARVRLALVIPISAPITVAKDAIETPSLVTDKIV